MSYTLETLNKGRPTEPFGYFFGDVTSVMLGELPPIGLQKFSRYATDTIIQEYDLANKRQRLKMLRIISRTEERLQGAKVRSTKNPNYDLRLQHPKAAGSLNTGEGLIEAVEMPGDFAREITEAISRGDDSRIAELGLELFVNMHLAEGLEVGNYTTNPFRALRGQVDISGVYVVDAIEFTTFGGYVLAGGLGGWGNLGVTDFILDDVTRMGKAIRGFRAP